MKDNTICYLVEFNDWTRAACVEELPEGAYRSITIKEGQTQTIRPAWQATIGFVKRIHKLGVEQGKDMTFKVVIARKNGTLRYAKKSEWHSPTKNRESHRRTVKRVIPKRVGRLS